MGPYLVRSSLLCLALVSFAGPPALAAEDDVQEHCARSRAVTSCRYAVLDARGQALARLGYFRPNSTFAGAMALDPEVLDGPSKAHRLRIEQKLPAPRDPDGSLMWLLDALDHPRVAPSEGPMRWASRVAVRWRRGPATAPQTYRAFVAPDRWPRVRARWTDPAVLYPRERARLKTSAAGWLMYFGEDHGGLRSVQDDERGRLVISRHGVALERDGQHAWLYVHGLDPAGGKSLATPSVAAAHLRDGVIIVTLQHGEVERRLLAIDIDTGGYGEIDLHNLSFVAPEPGPREVADRWLIREGQLELVRIERAAVLDYRVIRQAISRAVGAGELFGQAPGAAPRATVVAGRE